MKKDDPLHLPVEGFHKIENIDPASAGIAIFVLPVPLIVEDHGGA